MPRRFEYKTVYIIPYQVDRDLTKYGSEGWSVVQAIGMSPQQKQIYLLEREVPDEPAVAE